MLVLLLLLLLQQQRQQQRQWQHGLNAGSHRVVVRTDEGKGKGKEDDFAGPLTIFSALSEVPVCCHYCCWLLQQQQRQRQHGHNSGSHGTVVRTMKARGGRRKILPVLQPSTPQQSALLLCCRCCSCCCSSRGTAGTAHVQHR